MEESVSLINKSIDKIDGRISEISKRLYEKTKNDLKKSKCHKIETNKEIIFQNDRNCFYEIEYKMLTDFQGNLLNTFWKRIKFIIWGKI